MTITLENADERIQEGAELYNLLSQHSSHYSVDDRLKACALYVAEGNLMAVSRKTGVKYETLKTWKEQSWWPAAAKEFRIRKQEELDGLMSDVIHAAVDEVADRIRKGDWYIKKMEPKKESL